jgi:hypothetical protein
MVDGNGHDEPPKPSGKNLSPPVHQRPERDSAARTQRQAVKPRTTPGKDDQLMSKANASELPAGSGSFGCLELDAGAAVPSAPAKRMSIFEEDDEPVTRIAGARQAQNPLLEEDDFLCLLGSSAQRARTARLFEEDDDASIANPVKKSFFDD